MPPSHSWLRRRFTLAASSPSSAQSFACVALTGLAYLVAFRALYGWFGPAAAVLFLVPVLAAGVLLRPRWAFITALVIAPIHMAIYADLFADGRKGAIPAALVFGSVGALVGRLKHLKQEVERQRRELQLSLERETDARRLVVNRQEQLLFAQEVAHIGSWEADLASGRTTWSDELFRMIGYAPGDFEPSFRRYLEFTHPEDRSRVATAIEKARSEAGAYDLEHRALHRDGRTVFIHARGKMFPDAQGRPVKFSGTGHDVTELKEMQKRLLLADRLGSLGILAGGVAHEINNPLAFVISNLGFIAGELRDRKPLSPEQFEELIDVATVSLEGARRIRHIVSDLKTFSRADEDTQGPVDVQRAIDLSVKLAMNEIRQRARLVLEVAEVPEVDANEAKLGQLILNLLVNAAQSIPAGKIEANEIRIRTFASEPGSVTLEVRDTGTGIPPEILGRIWDPFFTTKPVGVGTGLGLSICHGIVRSFGGQIAVESVLGQGTTFRITLRSARDERVEDVVAPAKAQPSKSRILIIDDEPLIATAFKRMLAPDHDVELVTNANAGLARLAAAEFDVVLCDLMMRDMSGMDLHRALAESAPQYLPKIIFMTGGAFTPEAQAFLARVPNQVLDKPIEYDTLLAAIVRAQGTNGASTPSLTSHSLLGSPAVSGDALAASSPR
jgi:PAS domain S-box-containing protein